MVELKNGETYSGMLAACDGFMNLHLKNSVCTSKASSSLQHHDSTLRAVAAVVVTTAKTVQWECVGLYPEWVLPPVCFAYYVSL